MKKLKFRAFHTCGIAGVEAFLGKGETGNTPGEWADRDLALELCEAMAEIIRTSLKADEVLRRELNKSFGHPSKQSNHGAIAHATMQSRDAVARFRAVEKKIRAAGKSR